MLTLVPKSAILLTVTDSTDLLTTAEAAERLGTTVPTLNRWAAEGKIPTARKLPGLRGARLFLPADLDAFLASAAAPSSETGAGA